MQDPTFLIIAALAVPVIAFVLLIWAFIVTKLRLRRPYCRDCGASLPADVGEVCPQCGRRLDESDEEDDVPDELVDGEPLDSEP